MLNVSIIIPMFNEEEGIPQLFTKLKVVNDLLKSEYNLHYIFVDDGSKDKTYELLSQYKDQLPNHTLLKHEVNQNLGAALKTGIKHVQNADYIGFLDSDCTYDPQILKSLFESLDKGADLAVVSPYHPQGKVAGVPAWRLLLSKGLSFIYRSISGSTLYTYTAMVRAIKAQHVQTLVNPRNDFSFVAIGTLNAIFNKLKVAEIPATLNVREFGTSKMNIVKTILSHLKIVFSLIKENKI